MKTEVIMKRELFGEIISQKSKTEFFSATDLVRAGNKWRIGNSLEPFNMKQWFQTKSSKEFMKSLENKYGKCKISGRGRGKHTWVHPLLFIDIALAISPELKIEVYEWLFDHLIKNRNESGDSYTEMCGVIFRQSTTPSTFPREIMRIANEIRLACGVDNWEEATEDQLKLRTKIHDSIRLLCSVLKNVDQAVELGISENIK